MTRLTSLVNHLTFKAKPLWVSIIPIAVLFAVSVTLWGPTEKAFRISGLGLQIVGLFLVVRALSQALTTFGHASPIESAVTWFRDLVRLLGFPRKPITHRVLVAEGAVVTAEAGNATLTFGGDGTLEGRVKALEHNLTQLKRDLSTLSTELKGSLSKLHNDLEHSLAAQTKTSRELRELMETLAVGDSHWDIVGVVWLFAGTLFAGIPQELADGLSHLPSWS